MNAYNEDPDLLSPKSGKSIEDLNHELREQQERLLELKRQQEEIERRKGELEELNKKRTELSQGKKSMKEKLSRGITILERSEYDCRKEIEQIQITRQSFTEHLDEIDNIDPSQWTPQSMDEELTKSLSLIDNAKATYSHSRAKIDALNGKDLEGSGRSSDEEEYEEGSENPAGEVSFFEMVRRGFAFTLPLIIFLTVMTLVLILKH